MSARQPVAVYWLLAAAGAAVALRLAGICWSLPHTLNSDEPHLVNLAVSFGSGSLRPYSLKYPTFWPYVLFATYGLYFLGWSGFLLRRGVSEFVGHFAWNPGPFYLIGRLLSAAFSLIGGWLIWREEKEHDSEAVPWAALLLAVSPVIVELAHSAKPDCLMFAAACLGWRHSLRVVRGGGRRDYLLAGVGFGLAAATQYTAAPAALTLAVAHFAASRARTLRPLIEGIAASALALALASPYVLLDFGRTLESLRDMSALMALRTYDPAVMLPLVLRNAWSFAGAGSIAGAAAVAGLFLLWRQDRGRALTLAAAPLAYVVLLAGYPDGGWARYMLAAFPGLALLAAEGLEAARRRLASSWATALLLLLAAGPGAILSARMDLVMRLPDTRADAAEWLRGRVPPGTTILLDMPHASPDLPMTKEQSLELAAKTQAAGSPRARLYRGYAQAHPGGGWRVLRVKRTARDLGSGPQHVERSQSETPVLDVAAGYRALKAAGVKWAVTSDYGATRATLPELSAYFDALEQKGRLAAVFWARPGESQGPTLRVFELP